MVELGQIEKMSGLELIVPGSAKAGLVQKKGLLTLFNALVIMYLNLPEERGKDFNVVAGPAHC